MSNSSNKAYVQNNNQGQINNADIIIIYNNVDSGKSQEISINLRELCNATLKNQLETQVFRHKATEKGYEINVYVPLGLEERKEQPRWNMLDNVQQRNVQQREFHQPKKEVISRIYEHEEFLQQIIGQNPTEGNKHIAIIGEPGAGKTTLLSAIASFILNPNPTPLADRGENSTENLAIFISLASLEKRTLNDYLLKIWLVEAMRLVYPEVVLTEEVEKQLQHQLIQRFKKGGMWLLLDGVDEIGLDSFKVFDTIQEQLNKSLWLTQARLVLTCRLNVWDAMNKNPLKGFDAYKTQDLKPGDVDKFIKEWFDCAKLPERGEQLQRQLKESGKELIRELVKNPLRLSLLCQIFYLNQQAQLPKTKAELYQKYITYFSEWKQKNLSRKQQKNLYKFLRKLALSGMNNKFMFFFPESFIDEVMEDELEDELFESACDFWLNRVYRDDKTGKAIYAFPHRTFQEYFAACAIEDSDFFLPNEHIDRPVEGKSYRIFELQWKEVFLFWLGRENVEMKKKEQFLNALVGFKDGCNDFYLYKAYFLTAVGIVEFEEYFKAPEIVKQLVEWINLPLSSDETEEAIQQAERSIIISDKAKEAIQQTERSIAITNLVELINKPEYKFSRNLSVSSIQEMFATGVENVDDYSELLKKHYDESIRIEAASILGTIDKGNLIAINTLVKFITETEDQENFKKAISSLVEIAKDYLEVTFFLVDLIDEYPDGIYRWNMIEKLGEFNKNNPIVMDALNDLIDSSQHPDTRWIAAESLGKIDNNNPIAVDALIDLISLPHESTPYQAIVSLEKIAKNNPKVIVALGDLMDQSQDENLRFQAAKSLIKIDKHNSKAIDFLLHVLNNSQDEYARVQAAATLVGEVEKNSKAINFLLYVLDNFQDEELLCITAKSLGKIDEYNLKAINVLVDLIKNAQNSNFRNEAVNGLEEIGKDSPIAIAALVELIHKPQNKDILREVVSSLGKIGKDSPIAIAALVPLIHSQDKSINWQAELSLWNCIQNTPYPEFYQFWQQTQTLLDALEPEEQKFLARLSVFNLPVTEEIVQAISIANELAVLSKLTSRKLIESTTTYPDQLTNYQVTTILEPFLEPVLTEEEWQLARQQAVKKIYQLWWEESENKPEAQAQEIVRLGLLAKEKEIAVSVGNTIAERWIDKSYRFQEAKKLCLQILEIYEDYRIMANFAQVEGILGFVENADKYFQRALELCPPEDLQKKGEILNNMGVLYHQKGEFEQALEFYEQSLQISESINYGYGKAGNLLNMGSLYYQKGEFEQALEFYEQSLQMNESIKDMHDKAVAKATTLYQIATLYAHKGENERALELYKQSLQIHESINNAPGKAENLNAMAVLYLNKLEIDHALELHAQSFKINKSINNKVGIDNNLKVLDEFNKVEMLIEKKIKENLAEEPTED